jgi:hypothetical protein
MDTPVIVTICIDDVTNHLKFSSKWRIEQAETRIREQYGLFLGAIVRGDGFQVLPTDLMEDGQKYEFVNFRASLSPEGCNSFKYLLYRTLSKCF